MQIGMSISATIYNKNVGAGNFSKNKNHMPSSIPQTNNIYVHFFPLNVLLHTFISYLSHY